jgi:hypothetical protein
MRLLKLAAVAALAANFFAAAGPIDRSGLSVVPTGMYMALLFVQSICFDFCLLVDHRAQIY